MIIYNEKGGIDITLIEIKPNIDKISNSLEIDDEILELQCKRKTIYILHYPEDKRLVSYGLMKDLIEGKKISHYCNTKDGSSGSPILSLSNYKVIGVHYGGSKSKNIKINFGTFIKCVIKELNNKYKNEKNNEYNKVKETNEISIKYQIGKEDKLRIFGDAFVKNNKGNFQMVINNINYELNSFYAIKNEKENEILKIRLKQIKNTANLKALFSECFALTELHGISKLDTSKVIDMSFMFNKCSSLTSLSDISEWNTNNVTTMKCIFQGCSSLTDLPDISKWNTSKVTDMSFIFNKCSKLSSLPDISKWNTNNVTNMKQIFQLCSSLNELPEKG